MHNITKSILINRLVYILDRLVSTTNCMSREFSKHADSPWTGLVWQK